MLDALREGPRHGYELIKSLEDRSSGGYSPSPGSVYPTLQYLEELGQVTSEQQADRKMYELTPTGQVELDAHRAEVDAFWAQFSRPVTSKSSQTEVGFLQDSLEQFNNTVWGGLRSAMETDDIPAIRLVRQAIERCQIDVRTILSGDVA